MKTLSWALFLPGTSWGGSSRQACHSVQYTLEGRRLLLKLTIVCLLQKSGSIEPQQASVDLRGLEFSRKVHDPLAVCGL